jgi:hypothetical protein
VSAEQETSSAWVSYGGARERSPLTVEEWFELYRATHCKCGHELYVGFGLAGGPGYGTYVGCDGCGMFAKKQSIE